MKTNALMLLGALLLGMFWTFGSERVRVGDGLGWDGKRYGKWAGNFPAFVLRKNVLKESQLQRVLSSGAVYGLMQVTKTEPTTENILQTYLFYNSFLLLVIIALWGALADSATLSPRAKWLGFTILLLNCGILKSMPYTPASNDTTAYALGMGVLYCYWTGRSVWLLTCIILSMFAWPVTLYGTAALLFLFPRRKEAVPESSSIRTRVLFAGAVAVILMGVALNGYHSEIDRMLPEKIDERLVDLSWAILGAYLFAAFYWLGDWKTLFDFRAWGRRLWTPRLALVVGAVGAVRGLQIYFSRASEPDLGEVYVALVTVSGIVKPALFLVAHVTYYGPGILLCAIFWKPICAFLHENGIGLTLYAMAAVAMSLVTESRSSLINFMPLVALATAKASEALSWRKSYYAAFAVLSLVWSRIWMSFHSRANESLTFATHGPWMKMDDYLVHLGFAFATTVVLWPLWRRRTMPTAR